MFTAARVGAVINIAAGKAAEVVDTRKVAARIALCQRSGLLADKQRRAERQRTAGKKAPVQADRTEVTHAHDVVKRTRAAAVRHRLGVDEISLVSLREQALARLGV